ncbi:Helix-turn-helix domain-containing protein [Amycolatopsis arida]|uniref:Helix-turn-helix domain-containing protein n=1 Tax=Amycolatopsis arida TaxID=587909 RepID=A0A1I5XUY1_9PSEU|nr:helix-turn-helix protein [Amycolatopsis arida]SFQ35728.1 Helix-turn-helix domain-containing protein [Amycolatopsis arida]
MRSRELGEALRRGMERRGMTGRDVARMLGWSDSRVSRLLSGKRGGREVDISAVCATTRIIGPERERLLKLCRDVNTPGWLQRHGARLPKQLRTLVDHENKATKITDFQPMVVPGLLQTEDYARGLLSGLGTLPEEELDDRVTARMERQKMLGNCRCEHFTFFIHEFALRLPVGSNEVMSDQLHHLLRMSVRPYITIRVISAAAGVHAGIAGAFKLMEFADITPVVYLDSQTACLFLEEHDEIGAYRRVLDVLADIALDEGESREVIARLATELYP